MQKKPLQDQRRLKSAEVKLIAMIIHYLIVGLYTMLSANIILRNIPAHGHVLADHFTCEAIGDETVTCSRENFKQLQQDSFIQTFVYLGYNLYPTIFFIFLHEEMQKNDWSRLALKHAISSKHHRLKYHVGYDSLYIRTHRQIHVYTTDRLVL